MKASRLLVNLLLCGVLSYVQCHRMNEPRTLERDPLSASTYRKTQIAHTSYGSDESSRQRLLPGADYGFDVGEFNSAEAGFLAGMLFFVVLICLMVCCCCGGCSLWDFVALACLWEICSDRGDAGGVGDFILV